MSATRTGDRPPSVSRLAVMVTVGVITVGVIAVGCDAGDGRDLDPPVFPPPATTVPVESLPDPLPDVMPDTVEPAASLELVAPWRDGATIPARHTCDGADVSPALTWSNVPDGTVELAITMTDLDAPDFVHWVVFGIPAEILRIDEGGLPGGAISWPNGSGAEAYSGPCPPAGEEHWYVVTLHALNQQVEPADEMPANEIIEILDLTSIDQTSVSGPYARAG